MIVQYRYAADRGVPVFFQKEYLQVRIRSLFCLLSVFVLLFACVPVCGEEEEIVEEVMLDEEEEPEETPADVPEEEPADVFTPSHGSP